MSSILDALRKLEEEKAQHVAAPETPLPIEPQTREPAPRRTRARKSQQQSSPKIWIAVAGAVFVLGVVGAAVFRGGTPESGEDSLAVAAVENTPSAENDQGARDPKLERIEADLRVVAEASLQEVPVMQDAPVVTPDTAVVQDVAPSTEVEPTPEPQEPAPAPIAQPEPVTEQVAATNAPIQVDVTPVTPAPEPAPLEEPIFDSELAPEMVPIEMLETSTPPPLPEPQIEESPPPVRREPSENYKRMMEATEVYRGTTTNEPEPEPQVEEDIRRYDIMTRTIRARYDIPELNINMLMLPNDANPDPSALINYNRVYVGETILGTNGRVHLVGVDIRGIAVEVEGKRYYYPK